MVVHSKMVKLHGHVVELHHAVLLAMSAYLALDTADALITVVCWPTAGRAVATLRSIAGMAFGILLLTQHRSSGASVAHPLALAALGGISLLTRCALLFDSRGCDDEDKEKTPLD